MNWHELLEQRNWKRIKSLLLADHSRCEVRHSAGYILDLMGKNDVEAVKALLNIVSHWKLAPYSQLEGKNYVLGSIHRPDEHTKIAMIDTVLNNFPAANKWCEDNSEVFLRTLMDQKCVSLFDEYYGRFCIDSSTRYGLLISATNMYNLEAFKTIFSDDKKDIHGSLLARACRQEFKELIEFLLPYSNTKEAHKRLWEDYPRNIGVKAIAQLNDVVSEQQRQKLQRILGNTGLSTQYKKM